MKHHARVYLGARSEAKAGAAIASIKEAVPDADVRFLLMDLMKLENVVAAAKELAGSVLAETPIQPTYARVDCYFRKEIQLHGIVNNAGIMAVNFEMTVDNFESQFQVGFHCFKTDYDSGRESFRS